MQFADFGLRNEACMPDACDVSATRVVMCCKSVGCRMQRKSVNQLAAPVVLRWHNFSSIACKLAYKVTYPHAVKFVFSFVNRHHGTMVLLRRLGGHPLCTHNSVGNTDQFRQSIGCERSHLSVNYHT